MRTECKVYHCFFSGRQCEYNKLLIAHGSGRFVLRKESFFLFLLSSVFLCFVHCVLINRIYIQSAGLLYIPYFYSSFIALTIEFLGPHIAKVSGVCGTIAEIVQGGGLSKKGATGDNRTYNHTVWTVQKLYCMSLDWGKKLGNPEETPEALSENGKSMHTRWRQESNPVLMF